MPKVCSIESSSGCQAAVNVKNLPIEDINENSLYDYNDVDDVLDKLLLVIPGSYYSFFLIQTFCGVFINSSISSFSDSSMFKTRDWRAFKQQMVNLQKKAHPFKKNYVSHSAETSCNGKLLVYRVKIQLLANISISMQDFQRWSYRRGRNFSSRLCVQCICLNRPEMPSW